MPRVEEEEKKGEEQARGRRAEETRWEEGKEMRA